MILVGMLAMLLLIWITDEFKDMHWFDKFFCVCCGWAMIAIFILKGIEEITEQNDKLINQGGNHETKTTKN